MNTKKKKKKKNNNVIKSSNFAGPPILKGEIRAAIRRMKSGRKTVKLLKALEDCEVNKIATLLSKISDTKNIQPDISRSRVI